jgi:hypothetical protein
MGSLGTNTNNSTKLVVIEQGLWIGITQGYDKPMVEIYSLILINVSKQMLNGTHMDRLTHNLRLFIGMEAVTKCIAFIHVLILPLHVKRKENCLVDFLANEGVIMTNQM